MNGVSRFYDFDEITKVGDCLHFAIHHCGMTPVRGHSDRFNAPWRPDSDSGSLAINKAGFCYHAAKNDQEKSGGIIRFCELVKGMSTQEAQQYLGDLYKLTPKKMKKPTTATIESLLNDGYKVAATYEYKDEAGVVRHTVTRLEHPTRKKEFVQGSPAGGQSLKGVKRLLYRLPEWIGLDWVCICEGEKCADAVAAMGLPATTNCGGAGSWEAHYDEWLRGKNIVIFEDNDEPGRNRTAALASRLTKVGKALKVIRFAERGEGFDVADWLAEDKSRGRGELFALAKSAAPYAGSDLELAKLANAEPLCNYFEEKVGKKPVPRPRQISDIIADCHRRFLRFPRLIGERLFDHDRDSGRINILSGQDELFSWMQIKSKHHLPWKRGEEGFVTKAEFFAALTQQAIRYEGVHHVPDWPKRKDVYYTCPDPEPVTDGAGALFWELVDRFNPATREDRALLAALFVAPIYYESGIPRPMWVIDSDSSQSGKTTLASMVAELYAHPPIEVKVKDLTRDTQEITKRLVSSEGRQARIVLIDNVTNTMSSQELAAFATLPNISGRAPYGKGEEVRPNNLTWILTANSAALDNDLAIRSFIIRLSRPPAYDPDWRTDTSTFIAENRAGIFNDIVQMLNTHRRFSLPPISRFPEFEVKIVQPCCVSEDGYANLMKTVLESRNAANVDEDLGKQVEDIIRSKLADLSVDPDKNSAFIHSQVAERWFSGIHALRSGNPIAYVRSLAREGHAPHINPKVQIWPHHGRERRRGILWSGEGNETENPTVVVRSDGDKKEIASA